MDPNRSTALTRFGAALLAAALGWHGTWLAGILFSEFCGTGLAVPVGVAYLVVRCFPQESPRRSAAATATSFALWFVFFAPRINGDGDERGWVSAVCAALVWLFSLPLCLLGADMAEKAMRRQKGS